MTIALNKQGFIERFPTLQSEWDQLTQNDPAVESRAADEVNNLIMQHVAGRYGWPLQENCPYLVDQAYLLFRCALYSFDIPPEAREKCTEAREWLQKISSGRLDLISEFGVLIDEVASPVTQSGAADPSAGSREMMYGPAFERRYRWT